MGNSASGPLPPSQDPWYSAPSGFASAAPGAILKTRSADGLASQIANVSSAYQFLYRTTDSNYQPSWAVSTFLIPKNVSTDCAKLLVYGIPYDSADVDASPSYSLYSGGGIFGSGDLSAALGRGWYVSTADYEGPNASFTAGVQSGHANIDSTRAALSSSNPVKLPSNTRYAMWGYSGGALASEWASELQVQYAPELNFAGSALGGLTPNVSSVLLTINGTVYAGLAPAGILGLSSQHPEARTYLEAHLRNDGDPVYNAANFNKAVNYSLAETIGAYINQNITKYFTNGFDALLSPISQRIINTDGTMGYHGVPQMPIFAYKAIKDDISVIADTDKLVNRYCEVGATIDYQRNTVGNHASESGNGAARALSFLDQVLNGAYTASGCTITNVTVGS